MARVAVVTDSLSCLPREMVEKHGIRIVPIIISIMGKTYRDWIDITPTQAYELFLKDPDSFKTSPSSPPMYEEVFREVGRGGHDILCVSVSSRLSTSCHVAEMAAKTVMKELPGNRIVVVDSQTVTAAEGLVVEAAARAACAGKDLDAAAAAAAEVRGKVTFLAVLDTIRHVYRTGRVPKIAAQAGAVLHIRPILTSSGGIVRMASLARNMRQGIDKVLKMMRTRLGTAPARVAVMHAYAPEEGEKLKERIASEFNCCDLWLGEFSPVMGYATGTGALGVAFYRDGGATAPRTHRLA